MKSPLVVAFTGPKGSGKSYLSRETVRLLRFEFPHYLEYISLLSFSTPLKEAFRCHFHKKWDDLPDKENYRWFMTGVADLIKANSGQDFYASCLLREINLRKDNLLFVIDDLRYLSEYKTLKDNFNNLLVIKVVKNDFVINKDSHSSELEWAHIPADLEVTNDFSEDIFQKTYNFIKSEILYGNREE